MSQTTTPHFTGFNPLDPQLSQGATVEPDWLTMFHSMLTPDQIASIAPTQATGGLAPQAQVQASIQQAQPLWNSLVVNPGTGSAALGAPAQPTPQPVINEPLNGADGGPSR